MIDPEVDSVLNEIRAAIVQDPEWNMMNVVGEESAAVSLEGVPDSYLDFVRVADGFSCGPVLLFDSDSVLSNQYLTEMPAGVPVQLLSEEWFCAGTVSDEPWFVHRESQTVWHFPDAGVIWWMSDQFEQVAVSLSRFFLDVVCGPGYLSLCGARVGDQWWRLLERLERPGIS